MKITGILIFKLFCTAFVALCMFGSLYYIIFEPGDALPVTRILGGAFTLMFCPFMIYLLWKDLTRG